MDLSIGIDRRLSCSIEVGGGNLLCTINLTQALVDVNTTGVTVRGTWLVPGSFLIGVTRIGSSALRTLMSNWRLWL
jgi:hypothetical protein